MSYLKEKLSGILIRINFHEENANIRLASEADAIYRLSLIPDQFADKMNEFKDLILKTKKLYGDGVKIYKFTGMSNKKAVEYIKLLHAVYDSID